MTICLGHALTIPIPPRADTHLRTGMPIAIASRILIARGYRVSRGRVVHRPHLAWALTA